jgi:hypothetical protein
MGAALDHAPAQAPRKAATAKLRCHSRGKGPAALRYAQLTLLNCLNHDTVLLLRIRDLYNMTGRGGGRSKHVVNYMSVHACMWFTCCTDSIAVHNLIHNMNQHTARVSSELSATCPHITDLHAPCPADPSMWYITIPSDLIAGVNDHHTPLQVIC